MYSNFEIWAYYYLFRNGPEHLVGADSEVYKTKMTAHRVLNCISSRITKAVAYSSAPKTLSFTDGSL